MPMFGLWFEYLPGGSEAVIRDILLDFSLCPGQSWADEPEALGTWKWPLCP